MTTRIALVPGVLALLPEYAGQVDPVADLRAACLQAVAWLGPDVTVIADTQGARVAEALLAGLDTSASALYSTNEGGSPRALSSTNEGGSASALSSTGEGCGGALSSTSEGGGAGAPYSTDEAGAAYLIVANGSACRTEKAPGFLDQRATGFDGTLGAALQTGDRVHLRGFDRALAEELAVGNPAGFAALADLLTGAERAVVDYADDPFGVQYWVMRWRCES